MAAPGRHQLNGKNLKTSRARKLVITHDLGSKKTMTLVIVLGRQEC